MARLGANDAPAVEPEGGKRRARRRAGGGQTPRPVEPEGGKRRAPSSRWGATNTPPRN